jgi:hypothetical protein
MEPSNREEPIIPAALIIMMMFMDIKSMVIFAFLLAAALNAGNYIQAVSGCQPYLLIQIAYQKKRHRNREESLTP